jgi:hypothetical protein
LVGYTKDRIPPTFVSIEIEGKNNVIKGNQKRQHILDHPRLATSPCHNL